MNLTQLEEIKTEAFYWVEFHISILNQFAEYQSYVLKCKRCTQNVKLWFIGCKQTVDESSGVLAGEGTPPPQLAIIGGRKNEKGRRSHAEFWKWENAFEKI
jgi:hypothetical protein